VGERMEAAVNEIKELGYPVENIFYFEDPVLAGQKLQQVIREGDLILVKGSQGMRMEKIVEEVMANPQEAERLLCRQAKNWKDKPFTKP
jgi:UDP-N-acetylmuramoyl-tripeptide--D-alanyl-D-alanine ligase